LHAESHVQAVGIGEQARYVFWQNVVKATKPDMIHHLASIPGQPG